MIVARSSLLPSTIAAGASPLIDTALMTAGVPLAAGVDSAPACIATIAVTSGIEALRPRIFLTISYAVFCLKKKKTDEMSSLDWRDRSSIRQIGTSPRHKHSA